jgi:pyruvate,water dikinase
VPVRHQHFETLGSDQRLESTVDDRQRSPGASGGLVDVLHQPIAEDAYWTRSNVGEAMPGMLTPLGWTVFGTGGELALRGGTYMVGAFSRKERDIPSAPEERFLSIFYGRVAARADAFALIGDRIPGTSGTAVVDQVLGFVPPGMVDHPQYRRAPIIAARFPYAFLTTGRRVRRQEREAALWWREQIPAVAGLDREEAVALFGEARNLFNRNIIIASAAVLCAITPMYEQLKRLVDKVGVGDVNAFMGGYGSHAETAVVEDMWAASRGTLTIDEVVDRHGYHGPREGEISGLMWREDRTPLVKMISNYAARSEDAAPHHIEAQRRRERQALERQLLAAVGPAARPAAKLVLRTAASIIPLRGVQKVAFLRSLDVARAAARRIGECLVSEGALADREDIFFLTAEEITGSLLPGEARSLVAQRRELYEEYRTLELPESWQGRPEPIRVSTSMDERADGPDAVSGIGVSPGVVEGVIRVVTDPAFEDVEPDEILVSPTTDPGWASIMFISKALVVDIGGTMSHAAVIARELGIPCVVNTKTGCRDLRTGDYCRVDGGAGTVEVLHRAAQADDTSTEPVSV